jgi:hypothetical protein
MQARFGVEFGVHLKHSDARQKRRGKRFQSVLAEVPVRSLGDPLIGLLTFLRPVVPQGAAIVILFFL